MKKHLGLALLFLLINGHAFGCEMLFKSEDLCLDISWEKLPPARQNGILNLKFTDAKDATRAITPKLIPNVVLWMTSMGHGSKKVTLEAIDVGHFRSTDVNFIMGGPWDIKFQLLDGAKVVEEIVMPIKIK